MKQIIKQWIGGVGICCLLVGCGNSKLPEGATLEKGAFNPQSAVRTRVQQEIEKNQSYQNIEYIHLYSLGSDVESIISYIKEQFQGIAPHMNTPFKELEFEAIKSDGELSIGSMNHYYLVNEKILVNFVVPESNSIKWNKTVSDIQFYYDVFDATSANLMDLIAKSIVQEIESPQTRLTIQTDEGGKPIKNYNFNGGIYQAIPNHLALSAPAIEWISGQLGLKDPTYLYGFSFNRYQ